MVYSNFGTQGGATKLIFEGLTISVACVLRREKIFELSYQIITQVKDTKVKPVSNGHCQKDQKVVFKTNYPLMLGKSIAENAAMLPTFI